MRNVLGDGPGHGVRLRFVEEPEPPGTAGAVKLAEPTARGALPDAQRRRADRHRLTAQIAQHEQTGARGTLALVPVPDPSAYGLVRARGPRGDASSSRSPAPIRPRTNLISAGAYVLERSILDLVAPDAQRLDRAGGLAAAGRQRAVRLPQRELLAGHRHARALPAGDLRHHRGQRRHRRARAPRATAGSRSTSDAEVLGRRDRPAGVVERGCRSPRGRTSAAWSCSARACRSAPAARSSGPSSSTGAIGARCDAARLHRGCGCASGTARRSPAAPCSARA